MSKIINRAINVIKKNNRSTALKITVDVSATAVAFFGMMWLTFAAATFSGEPTQLPTLSGKRNK